MALTITFPYTSGSTVYGQIFNMEDGDAYNVALGSFEVYDDTAPEDYAVSSVEIDSTGLFQMSYPSIPSGAYRAIFRLQEGAGPALTDPVIWTEDVYWTGSVIGPPPPPAAGAEQVNAYLYTYDELGVIEDGVQVHCKASSIIGDTDELVEVQYGYALDSAVRTETSDVDGLVTFTNLFKGVVYNFWRSGSTTPSRVWEVQIPADAANPFELPSLIGTP